jgi:hypothetical protein
VPERPDPLWRPVRQREHRPEQLRLLRQRVSDGDELRGRAMRLPYWHHALQRQLRPELPSGTNSQPDHLPVRKQHHRPLSTRGLSSGYCMLQDGKRIEQMLPEPQYIRVVLRGQVSRRHRISRVWLHHHLRCSRL